MTAANYRNLGTTSDSHEITRMIRRKSPIKALLLAIMGSESVHSFRSWEFTISEIVHVVLWKLKRPTSMSTSIEDVKQAINALKKVPGPESVSSKHPFF